MPTINEPITQRDLVEAVAHGILDDSDSGYCDCHSDNALCAPHYVRYRSDSDSIHDMAYSAYRSAALAYGEWDNYELHAAAEAFADKVVAAA